MATAKNPGVPVKYGIHEMLADAVGKTVSEVKAGLADIMNIPANATAVINGNKVDDSHKFLPGQSVEFIKEAGVKG